MIAVSNFTVTGIVLTVIVLAKRAGLPSAAIGALAPSPGPRPCSARWPRHCCAVLCRCGASCSESTGRRSAISRPCSGPTFTSSRERSLHKRSGFPIPTPRSRPTLRAYSSSPHRTSTLGVEHAARARSAAGPLAAGLFLSAVSPRLTIALLAGATVVVAALGTQSKSIRAIPPLDELTKATPPPSAPLTRLLLRLRHRSGHRVWGLWC